MKKIVTDNHEYEIIKNYKNVFQAEEFLSKCTDYFDEFDYILGDYSYEKLRLKGFNDAKNPNTKKINDISYLDEYLANYCAYNCGYFLLKKLK